MSELAIKDANVIIDLIYGEILETTLSGLDFTFIITDLVLEEITSPENASVQVKESINEGWISVKSFSPEEIIAIVEMQETNSALSLEDCSCLYYAKENSAVILTGDAALRKAAHRESVKVIGTIGILDTLIKDGILTEAQAAEALTKIMASNKRLPLGECESRLNKWVN